MHRFGLVAVWVAAGGTVGALIGTLNWALSFSGDHAARAYLLTLLMLFIPAGGLAGSVIALGLIAFRGARSGSSFLRLTRDSLSPTLRRSLWRGWLIVLGAGVAAITAYLGSAPRFAAKLSDGLYEPGASASQQPNLILISLDTVRPDHLGAYGYDAPISPAFDALAAKGVLFKRCVAASPWTIPSHATILTGISPSHIGPTMVPRWSRGRAPRLRIPTEATLLPEFLKMAGYHTAAFISSGTMKSFWGFGQGFDIYNEAFPPSLSAVSDRIFLSRRIRHLFNIPPSKHLRFLDPLLLALSNFFNDEAHGPTSDLHVSFHKSASRLYQGADEVNHKIFSWLERRPPRPFFLFVHYFDAHDPYDPPQSFAPPSYDSASGYFMHNGLGERILKNSGLLSPAEKAELIAGYDAEIAAMDHQLGLLLRRLSEAGALENAIVAIVSDHGESFGEHGLVWHGQHLYNNLTDSVFLLAGNDLPVGTVVETPVSAVDILPTLLDLIGELPSGRIEGSSLRPLLHGESLKRGPLFSEVFAPPEDHWTWNQPHLTRFSVELDGLKLISTVGEPPVLFDVVGDHDELHDLSENRPQDVERLQAILDTYVAQIRLAEPSDEEMTEEALEVLRSLGYVR